MPDPVPELSGGPAAVGLYGKMPAHGDFVRRALPGSFVAPWDAWLAAGIAAARERLGEGFASAWDEAPAWRFALPAGICGPDAVAGVMLPSADTVGRRFPLTVAALLPRGLPPEEGWFGTVEARARQAREGLLDADALTRVLAHGEGAAEAATMPALPETTLLGLFGEPPAAPPAPDPLPEAPPAEPAEPAGAEVPPEDWLHLFAADKAAEASAATPEAAPDADPPEGWQALFAGDDGDAPSPAKAAPEAEPEPEPEQMEAAPEGWLGLLGDARGQEAPAEPAPAGPAEPAAAAAVAGPPPEAWLDLLGAGPDAPKPAGPAPGDWKVLLTTPAPAPAEDVTRKLFGMEASAVIPALPPPSEAPALEPEPVPEPVPEAPVAAEPEPPAAAAAPVPPPERPSEGGWWTLGGVRLPAMVWALPALPPPEAFVFLLETEA
jgi:type VI secretion system protein ImpM